MPHLNRFSEANPVACGKAVRFAPGWIHNQDQLLYEGVARRLRSQQSLRPWRRFRAVSGVAGKGFAVKFRVIQRRDLENARSRFRVIQSNGREVEWGVHDTTSLWVPRSPVSENNCDSARHRA